MVQYIINPWRNHDELLHVRQQLYPGKNDEERRQAVALVSVWMQRGNCPHLVESSAILTSAILNDVPGNSTYCVRAAYAAAFCRFVTGLLDSHQDGRKKLSMYSIAENIGLPATYVELRHQATHEELPSLSKLRTATQKALRWIWDCYWVKLPTKDSSKRKENCEACVRRYVEEPDDCKRDGMDFDWRKWNSLSLIEAVRNVMDTTSDAWVLSRASNLYTEIAKDDESFGGAPSPESPAKNLEDLRREMVAMESDLRSEGTDDGPREDSKGTSSGNHFGGKGWTLWEGPWVPKPIGVV